jgi:hypothetical protein
LVPPILFFGKLPSENLSEDYTTQGLIRPKNSLKLFINKLVKIKYIEPLPVHASTDKYNGTLYRNIAT